MSDIVDILDSTTNNGNKYFLKYFSQNLNHNSIFQ